MPGLGRSGRLAVTALAVLIGAGLGIGAFTFHYAEGTSYLGTDPKSCAHCHIMRPQFDAWQKASHHTAATCVDCHLPASGLAKYIAKAENGYRHSRAFTFQDFHEPIQITPKNAAILQENCVRCHADLVHDQVDRGDPDGVTPGCVHCHRAVGHGPTAGLGGAHRSDEGDPP